MNRDLLEHLPPALPIDFFSLECEVPHFKSFSKKIEKHPLPDTTFLLHEEVFATISLGWNEEGILGFVEVKKPFEEARYPEVKEGDSIELFIDTRNIKSAGYATRFCHHIVILPMPCNGIECKELTRFRSEDSHPVTETLECEIKTQLLKHSYTVQFFLPEKVLCGYEPLSCPDIGFTYRINRLKGKPQHFSVSSLYYSIEQQPSLWATLHLKKEP